MDLNFSLLKLFCCSHFFSADLACLCLSLLTFKDNLYTNCKVRPYTNFKVTPYTNSRVSPFINDIFFKGSHFLGIYLCKVTPYIDLYMGSHFLVIYLCKVTPYI